MRKSIWPQTVENKMNHMAGLGFYIKKIENGMENYPQYMSVGVLPGYEEPGIYTWGFELDNVNVFTVSAVRFVKDSLLGYWHYEICDLDEVNDAIDFFTTLNKDFYLEPLPYDIPEEGEDDDTVD